MVTCFCFTPLNLSVEVFWQHINYSSPELGQNFGDMGHDLSFRLMKMSTWWIRLVFRYSFYLTKKQESTKIWVILVLLAHMET